MDRGMKKIPKEEESTEKHRCPMKMMTVRLLFVSQEGQEKFIA